MNTLARWYFGQGSPAHGNIARAAIWQDDVAEQGILRDVVAEGAKWTVYQNTNVPGSPRYVGVLQFVSPALTENLNWTAGHTIKMQLRCMRDTFTSAYLYINIRIMSADGTTLIGTLYEGAGPTTWSVTPNYTNRNLGGTVNVQNTVSQLIGHHMVVEIGCKGTFASGTQQAACYVQDLAAAGDLPENETDTTDKNPWIEFATGGATLIKIINE